MEEVTGIAIVPDDGLKKYLADSVVLLTSVRSGLADLLKAILEGDADSPKDLADKQADFEKALRRVFEAEDRFNDWYSKSTGDSLGGEIDFDAVRQEIGCQLARIRDCCAEE